MSGDSNQLTCEAFQNVIAELVGRGINVKDHPHAVACPGCRELLQDLETILAMRHPKLTKPPSDAKTPTLKRIY